MCTFDHAVALEVDAAQQRSGGRQPARVCDAHVCATRMRCSRSVHTRKYARARARAHMRMWCACSSVRTCCPRRGRSPSLQAARSACAARRQAGRPAHKAQSPLKSRPGVAARGGSCDWATAWGYGPAQTVMSIGMRYFDLTGRNTQGRQSISACAPGRCARAAGARGWHWALVLAGHVGGGRLLADHGHAVVISLAHTGRLGDALLKGVLALVREAHPHRLLDGPNGAPAKALSGVSSMGGGVT